MRLYSSRRWSIQSWKKLFTLLNSETLNEFSQFTRRKIIVACSAPIFPHSVKSSLGKNKLETKGKKVNNTVPLWNETEWIDPVDFYEIIDDSSSLLAPRRNIYQLIASRVE